MPYHPNGNSRATSRTWIWQHRNKTETAVALTHVPTGIRAEAYDRRSQAENLTGRCFVCGGRQPSNFASPSDRKPYPVIFGGLERRVACTR